MALLQRIDSEAARSYPEYVDSEKWYGDERTKYAVLKVEATSFVLAVLCMTLALVYDWSFIGP
jgi:hypothetical protein